jgi:hypothetical protein
LRIKIRNEHLGSKVNLSCKFGADLQTAENIIQYAGENGIKIAVRGYFCINPSNHLTNDKKNNFYFLQSHENIFSFLILKVLIRQM